MITTKNVIQNVLRYLLEWNICKRTDLDTVKDKFLTSIIRLYYGR